MNPIIGGALIGAGSNLLGGALGGIFGGQARGQQADQFQQQMMAQQQQLDFQMAAAKNGIQWRVADAKAAGISPLVALGAPTFNPGPISGGSSVVPNDTGDLGGAIGRAGQDISSAVQRTMTQEQRDAAALDTAYKTAMIGKAQSETQVNNATANSITARMAGLYQQPAFPSAAGGNQPIAGQPYGDVKYQADKVTSAGVGQPAVTAGTHPSVTFMRDSNGSLIAAPTNPAAIANPSVTNPEYLRFLWSNVITRGPSPPESMLPPGAVTWKWAAGRWTPTAYWPYERATLSGRRIKESW